MKHTSTLPGRKFHPAFLTALVVASISGAQAVRAQAHDVIEIKGHILMDDQDAMANSLEVVELDNRVCVPMDLRGNGQFRLALPLGSRAHLRFENPAYLTKEVLIDTKNADLCKDECRRNEHMRFEVQMTPQPQDKQLAYVGPVGVITFQKGSGRMKVHYDRTLVRARESDMVMVEQQTR